MTDLVDPELDFSSPTVQASPATSPVTSSTDLFGKPPNFDAGSDATSGKQAQSVDSDDSLALPKPKRVRTPSLEAAATAAAAAVAADQAALAAVAQVAAPAQPQPAAQPQAPTPAAQPAAPAALVPAAQPAAPAVPVVPTVPQPQPPAPTAPAALPSDSQPKGSVSDKPRHGRRGKGLAKKAAKRQGEAVDSEPPAKRQQAQSAPASGTAAERRAKQQAPRTAQAPSGAQKQQAPRAAQAPSGATQHQSHTGPAPNGAQRQYQQQPSVKAQPVNGYFLAGIDQRPPCFNGHPQPFKPSWQQQQLAGAQQVAVSQSQQIANVSALLDIKDKELKQLRQQITSLEGQLRRSHLDLERSDQQRRHYRVTSEQLQWRNRLAVDRIRCLERDVAQLTSSDLPEPDYSQYLLPKDWPAEPYSVSEQAGGSGTVGAVSDANGDS